MKLSLFPLALVVYTDNLPEGVGGAQQGPLVRIRPKYEDDKGMHAHELKHVHQFWIPVALGGVISVALSTVYPVLVGVGVHAMLYLTLKKYRMHCEVSAYKEQMRHPRADGTFMSAEEAAEKLAKPRYKLGITKEQALKLFLGK